MAGMGRWLLFIAFVIAGIPFTGLVGTGIRYALEGHPDERLPSWYGWVFALAALVVALLFAAAALNIAFEARQWPRLFRACLIALPIVALMSFGSPPLIAGVAALLLVSWVLKRRDAEPEADGPPAPSAPEA